MYNPKSLKAEEFIDHQEILDTLAYAGPEQGQRGADRPDPEQGSGAEGPRPTGRPRCCWPASMPEKVQEMYRLAEQIKKDFYGNRIVMFAPLYLSNYCVNGCVYCPYHAQKQAHLPEKADPGGNRAERSSPCRIWGISGWPLEAGEDPVNNPIEYILECIKTIYSIKHKNGAIRRVNVNIAATTVENYRKLKEAGIGTYILFQETYHKESYEQLHPTGPKHNYCLPHRGHGPGHGGRHRRCGPGRAVRPGAVPL